MIKIIIIIEDIGIELVGMEFGIEKCAMLVMEKGKIVKSVGTELPDVQVVTGRSKLQVFRNFRGR